jgi:alcohol dehydrogenase class IV
MPKLDAMQFNFTPIPKIIFGPGQIARLPELVPQSSRVLLVYNGSDTLAERVSKILTQPPTTIRQKGEPTISDIDKAVARGREENCNFILGAGGGSAIDAAKAIAGLLATGKPATDYMEVVGKGEKFTKPAVPWIAIPTTAGTGAEVTRNAVIGWPEKKFKASIRSGLLLPRYALIDPELGLDVPQHVTAASGMDALCQCIEAYVSINANPMTDAIAIKGVELAASFLKRACENGHDLEAREAMAQAALFSGIALTNAGLGAVHGFAAPLGANFPIPHGLICGLLLPHVIAANRKHGVLKYHDVDRAIGGDAEQVCARLVNELQLPRLSTFGFREENIGPIVDLAKRASSMRYNPVPLDDAELSAILRSVV